MDKHIDYNEGSASSTAVSASLSLTTDVLKNSGESASINTTRPKDVASNDPCSVHQLPQIFDTPPPLRVLDIRLQTSR